MNLASSTVTSHTGLMVRAADARYVEYRGSWVSELVGPAVGAELVAVTAVRIPPGRSWTPPDAREYEYIAVVLRGTATGTVNGTFGSTVGGGSARLGRAEALYSPTGTTFALTAIDSEVTAYAWRSSLPKNSPVGAAPRHFNSLFNAETQLVGFAGSGQVEPAGARGRMNFLFWPGTGSPRLCLHCGIMQPGETFNVHLHPDSEEAFFVLEGNGQIYLHDRWVDVGPGDGVFAPPGVLHGCRNAQSGPRARRVVAFGGPTPFDPTLYAAAGVSAEVR